MKLTHTARRTGRLSSFLKEEMGMSAGLMNRLKWHERILVNNRPEHTDFPVQPGDEITVFWDEPAPNYLPEDGELTVLYEDEHLLAVDKPAGMLIHPSRVKNTGTLANRVLGYYAKTGQESAFHPITRLDRDTFGVVLLAKNSHIHALLNTLQERGQLKKNYHALVYGSVATEGEIDAPIARNPLPSLLRHIDPSGKPARTLYRVLAQQPPVALLELHPVTGRTHQLRVHCAYMGWPILGDPQYGTAESQQFSKEKGYATQMLCACRLEFSHPVTGKMLCIQTKYTMPY